MSDAYNHVIRKREPGDAKWDTLAGKAGEKGVVDGRGDEARFSYPQRIVIDASGDLIVAGGGSHVLHRVTKTGEVSTLAGVGGSAGHADGQGAAARFNRPIGLALDVRTGHIYVGDVGGHCIRKVTSQGEVSTLAGKYKEKGCEDGVGDSARFDQPCGISLSPDGSSCIIADCNNHCLRTLSLQDLSVATIAGKAREAGFADGTCQEARFRNPSDLAVDDQGTIFLVR